MYWQNVVLFSELETFKPMKISKPDLECKNNKENFQRQFFLQSVFSCVPKALYFWDVIGGSRPLYQTLHVLAVSLNARL